jgi:hypothetical protein
MIQSMREIIPSAQAFAGKISMNGVLFFLRRSLGMGQFACGRAVTRSAGILQVILNPREDAGGTPALQNLAIGGILGLRIRLISR